VARTALVALRWLRHRDEKAQGLAEYALILALIGIVCIIALQFMGNQVSNQLSTIGSTLDSVRVNH
jgi:Flp pilus assembly pilin Flp